MLSNSFDYGYQVTQEKNMDLFYQSNNTNNDNNDNDNDNSFVSEITKKKYKILNDINSDKKEDNNNNSINNLKLVNKNYHEEKESEAIEVKEPNLNPEIILDEFEDKTESKKIDKIFDENNNNEMNNEDNSIDISNDNISNDISNDDISLDINGEPKKKKRKRIVKKKKKIRKLNIISDASPIEDINNQNNLDENNNNDNNIEEKNLKKEKIIKKRIIKKQFHLKGNNEYNIAPESENNNPIDNEDEIIPNKEQELKSPVSFTQNPKNEVDNYDDNQKENKNDNDNNETPSPPTLNAVENETNKEEVEVKRKRRK
jgi:hypothetical protein